jgi:hypothetical protein
MDRDTYADQLAEVAAQLAVRVRDDDPQANARWLNATLPNPDDRYALCFVLAAAVPDDRPWKALTAWAVLRLEHRQAQLRPHGTQAAAARHRYAGEDLCGPCRDSERTRDRDRKRIARAPAPPATTPASPSEQETAA